MNVPAREGRADRYNVVLCSARADHLPGIAVMQLSKRVYGSCMAGNLNGLASVRALVYITVHDQGIGLVHGQ